MMYAHIEMIFIGYCRDIEKKKKDNADEMANQKQEAEAAVC